MTQHFVQQDLKKWLHEDVGLFFPSSTSSLVDIFRIQFPYYDFTPHHEVASLECWILAQRPRLIVFDGLHLTTLAENEIKSLRETLSHWSIHSLIVSESLEEIKKWRNHAWPKVHFFHGNIRAKTLHNKLLAIVSEQRVLESPCVAVISDKPYLLSHVGMLLRHYGIHMMSLSDPSAENIMSPLACDHPEVLIWDVSCLADNGGALYHQLAQIKNPQNFSIFLVSETKQFPKNSWWLSDGIKHEIYFPENFNELMKKVSEVISKNRKIELQICRDTCTGLYVAATLIDVVEKEMSLAAKRGEEFALLRFQIDHIRELEEKYGSIFTHGLERNISFFIQNRVRASDFVAQGNRGEIFVLLPRVSQEGAHLIGQRLCHLFSKEGAFKDSADHLFKPHMNYKAYSYPHDIKDIEELKKIVYREDKKESETLNEVDQLLYR